MIADVLWLALFVGWVPVYGVYYWLFDALDGKWVMRGGALDAWAEEDRNFRWN